MCERTGTPRTGLVVGKFSPLHRGHEELVRVARAGCDALVVVSWSNPELPGCAAARRRRWLAWRFGAVDGVTCHVLDPAAYPDMPKNDAVDVDQRSFCARWLQTNGVAVDVVFTSEEYGSGFAAFLSEALARPVRHVAVDPARARVPVSATAVRAGESDAVDPGVLADYRAALAGMPGVDDTRAIADDVRPGPLPETT
jgi:hypothetical protein